MSTAVVVDTDVVSYLFKSHPIAHLYLPHLKDRTPMISFMTLAELDRWALEARWGEARKIRLLQYLEQFAVLPYNRDLCDGVPSAVESCAAVHCQFTPPPAGWLAAIHPGLPSGPTDPGSP